ncbi:alpha/beta hydrolase [Kriegella aquimaris]|uniref:Acetyl esterase/lipase n=1 Tax=Kriegella aquimaris TaxID=192904 RepID=A0A1G9TPW5_9FLAO|nr:alpha/beta hydrolase [Kriegella aquimaris]SDM49155.1 Acetyl esterase/lipase [Kriegella aquimaris]
MKKKIFLIVLLLGMVSSGFSQKKTITYKLIENLSYTDVYEGKKDDYMKERCKLDIYYPKNQKDFATVVWFHGGGLTGGEKSIPNDLKNKGNAVVAVNYRLHPKVKCPVYIEDAAASVAWVFRNIAKFGGDPAKIFVSGHSAGGYLASMVGLDKSYLAKFGVDANSIAGLIPFSGHTITHMTVRKENGVGNKQPVVDKFAPLFHVRADTPPLVLITGDREIEMLGRYEENAYMYRMMKVAGHKETSLYEMPGFDHGTMAWPASHILQKHIEKILKSKQD